ncbi:MAG: class IV adenylate cyclase [Candidatus Sungbacteria bacterium]|uniref:Class IV adenylate cyclase n=1 Tax=Candidatus Sungiibacteriota bacterium TaxID=2750080 RepID=A0A9D6LPF4_9BACT|nr:class IV adenylate cyclase [Candidatus Sungbacteria bacterium]
MKEIEIKFMVASFDAIIPKLKKLGARCEWKGLEESYFFDTRSKTLKSKRQMLRLRRWQGHSNSLTLKLEPEKDSAKFKIRDEYQITISDINVMRNILKFLGFREYMRYKKCREHWRVQDAAIELDTVYNLKFVEIEGSREAIHKMAAELGLDWSAMTTKGYLSIIRDLRRKPGR